MVDLELIILGALQGMPMHGYGLRQGLMASYGNRYFKLSNSSLYRALAKLESEGCIEGKKVPQENVPDRMMYNITEAGKKKLKKKAATPVKPSTTPGGYDFDFKTQAVHFGMLTKEERRRVTQPLYENSGEELKEALSKHEKFGQYLDRYQLAVLEQGIEELKHKHQFYGRLMEME
ncbi:putative PadR-like family transcriptional regulator [Methanocella paludicola SANAE]|uniref:PadR-like family transcriptional regulator n=1 Tax=Methanocella paludicola (strain DSM 17711 / JCM 13418 / NBRC 101707 / SANAE) TaxID=304371 RepID=D1Z132_METPS|nr:PadR family transcriptional regulator [Methanocella paludicola]BAI62404.1 putative PadR-like family transcriptional regulator [Methanocella paludicola SANAE]